MPSSDGANLIMDGIAPVYFTYFYPPGEFGRPVR
jgi:hypothetical protein